MSITSGIRITISDTIIKIFFRICPNCTCCMAQIDPIDRLMRAALISDDEFVGTLNNLLKHDLRISVRELSEKSGISQSSLYKLLHGRRSPNLSTLREIVRALRQFYHVGDEDFIGLIAARPVLESVEERVAEIDGHRMRVREYPVHTMEDAIVAAVRAEREGAIAIVCAPIVSSIIEQLVHVPVATIIPRESVQRAIELAARKAWI
jgi:predicted transcriptional regulator